MSVSKARVKYFLASFLWSMSTGCAASLPEIKGPLLAGEELITLATRPGVTVRILLVTPNATPKGVLLFFPGGEGYLVNAENGRPKRLFIREFREQGFLTAIVDVPSDQPFGMIGGDRFRRSEEHVEDVKKIIDFVYQKWPIPIYLLGHSAGATSVAYLAAVLKDDRVGGVILTSAVGEGSLGMVALHTVTYPALFFHHRADPCTSFAAAYQQHRRLVNSPRVSFVEVLGGDQSSPIGCKPRNPRSTSYEHGFSGKRHEVVTVITEWMTGGPVPEKIGP
jgi:acetyl esterase/lipase